MSADRIARAFPLVRMVAPGMTLSDWRQRALSYLRPADHAVASRGMFVVRNRDHYIHGLLSYRTDDDASGRRRLIVENFIAFDLLARAELVAMMLGLLDSLARENGCDAIHTNIADGDGALLAIDGAAMAWFAACGHHRDADGLAKSMTGTFLP